MHRNHAVAIAVAQRLLVGLGEFRGRGTGCGDPRTIVNVVGHVVDAVTQIGAVDEHMQRHLPDVELLELIWLQARRRVAHHDYGHGYRESSCCTPASASALSISSATAWCASKFQWMPSGLPRPLMTCSPTAALRSTSGTSCCSAQSLIALTVPARPWCAFPYVSATWTDGSDATIGMPGRLKSIAPRVISRYSAERCGGKAPRASGDNLGCAQQ